MIASAQGTTELAAAESGGSAATVSMIRTIIVPTDGSQPAAKAVEMAGDMAVMCKEGDPARRILEVATREKADLIVIGRRGLGDLKGFLIGSASNKVLHHADCGCVIVK